MKKIALIPGDGIGPEIIEAAVRVLDAVGRFEYVTCYAGGSAIDRFDDPLPEEFRRLVVRLAAHGFFALGAQLYRLGVRRGAQLRAVREFLLELRGGEPDEIFVVSVLARRVRRVDVLVLPVAGVPRAAPEQFFLVDHAFFHVILLRPYHGRNIAAEGCSRKRCGSAPCTVSVRRDTPPSSRTGRNRRCPNRSSPPRKRERAPPRARTRPRG